MTRQARQLPVPVLLALAVAGCQDPYRQQPGDDAQRPTTAPAAHTSTPGPQAGLVAAVAADSSSSARSTAKAFAARWINWDWRTAAAQQHALAGLATGPLAAELQASARAARDDQSLRRDKPSGRGSIAAINLRSDGRRAAGLIVTREQTYTDGRADLGGRRYHVYVIRLAAGPDRWGVTAWQPQP